jgi:hypothetical protein
MGFPCESGARLELLGLLPYALRLDPGDVANCDGSGAKVVLGLEAINRGTRSSIDAAELLASIGELEAM